MAVIAMPAAIIIANTIAQLLQTTEWLYPPLGDFKSQTAYKTWPNRLPTLDQLASIMRRGGLDKSSYNQLSEQLGFNTEFSDKIYSLTESYLSAGDYINLFRREKINRSQLDSYLTKLGYSPVDIENAINATEYFPPPSDLVSFAVRDAYSQDIVNRFQLLEGLPDRFLQEAKKSGMPVEMAKLYWSAHWRLPSATQGFEMLHRGLVTKDDVNALLQALDYSPFWRDKLTKLSYRTLTRVDVRRMYKLGVIDEAAVNRSYLDIGYTPEDAERMTQFTVRYEQSEGEGLTKTAVINAYKNDYITELEFREYLKLLGMGEDVVNFYVNLANAEKETQDLAELSVFLRQAYLSGNITLEQAVKEFQSNGAPQSLVESFTLKLRTRNLQRTKFPPKGDLDSWMKLGIIDESEYAMRMSNLGYTESDISLYLTEFMIENPEGAVKRLPLGTYTRWLKKKIITEVEYRNILKSMGYDETNISRLIMEVKTSA